MLSLLLPVTCAACGCAGGAVCSACEALVRRAEQGTPPAGVDACAAYAVYEGVTRSIVTALKYRGRRSAVGWMASRLVELVPAHRPCVVTWAPTTSERARRRGYDHAELLARAVARRAGLPCVPLLRRRAGPAQTGRTSRERVAGASFVPLRPVRLPVLLVDDVVTTGATLTAAARALRAAGAPAVSALTMARTPLKKFVP